jgi:hypothetical protein
MTIVGGGLIQVFEFKTTIAGPFVAKLTAAHIYHFNESFAINRARINMTDILA